MLVGLLVDVAPTVGSRRFWGRTRNLELASRVQDLQGEKHDICFPEDVCFAALLVGHLHKVYLGLTPVGKRLGLE